MNPSAHNFPSGSITNVRARLKIRTYSHLSLNFTHSLFLSRKQCTAASTNCLLTENVVKIRSEDEERLMVVGRRERRLITAQETRLDKTEQTHRRSGKYTQNNMILYTVYNTRITYDNNYTSTLKIIIIYKH